MKIHSLASKLKRELSRNKAKSAVLGVMSLVAVYFWGPLVWSWVGGSSTPEVMPNKHESAVTAVVAFAPAITETNQAASNLHWKHYMELIDQDPQMASAELGETTFDPFRRLYRPDPEEVEIAESEDVGEIDTPEVEMVKDYDPAELGLELESVFIGRTNQVAKIGGTRYRERDLIVVASGVEFELSKVRRDSVVLSRNGKDFTLMLKRKPLGAVSRNLYERPS